VCVNVLKRDWKADMGLSHILTVIRCLLVEPNAESALNEEAGMLLLEGFEEFAQKARMMTEIHAAHRSAAGGRKSSVLTEVNTSGGAEEQQKVGGAGAGMGGKVGNAKGVGKKPKVADMKKKSLRRL